MCCNYNLINYMEFPHKIIAIDIETNGTNSKTGSIIQMGAVLIDEEFEIKGEYNAYIKPIDEYWNEEARNVHKIEKEWLLENGKDPLDFLKEFEEFAKTWDCRVILASWGNYFDATFVKDYYMRLTKKYPFSYRSIDLKSIALWELAKRGIPMNYERGHGVESFLSQLGMKFEGTPHNALDDIKNTIKIMQKLRDM